MLSVEIGYSIDYSLLQYLPASGQAVEIDFFSLNGGIQFSLLIVTNVIKR